VKKIFSEKGVQQIVKEKNRLDFGYDFIPYVIQTGRPVFGYTLRGNWFDIGTPRSYLEAMKKLLYGGFPAVSDFGGRLEDGSLVWVQGESGDSEKRRQEIIHKIKQKKITLEGAVLIGRHCEIDDGARIVNSCIDNFTRIGKNALVVNSSIMDRVIIGEHAEIHDSIIGRHVVVNSSQRCPTKITAVSVVADDVRLEEGCTLAASKIYPHQTIRGEFQNQTIMVN
jgi:NDP-sugar pyrophosphorylase family protein